MVHPCFGFPLRNGSIILAAVDIIGSIFGALSSIVTIIFVTGMKGQVKDMTGKKNDQIPVMHNGLARLMEQSAGFVVGVLIFVTTMCLLELILGILLLQGAKLRNVTYCSIWWKIKCVMFFLGTGTVLFALITSEDRLDFAVGGIFGFLYQGYALWVVKAFINELLFPVDCEQKGIEKL